MSTCTEHVVVQHGQDALLAAIGRAAGLTAALVLSACDKLPPKAPAPTLEAAQSTARPTTAGAADASVPSAASVLAPPTSDLAGSAAGRSNRAMSRAQESGAMPMPGQNNDHSAPLAPAKTASAP